jgi:hypothetical protein
MEKKVGLQVELMRDKSVGIRLSLMLVEGDTVMHEHFHRFPPMTPGTDLSEWRAAIESHIAMSHEVNNIPFAPWPAIPDEEWREVQAVARIAHTPARIEKQRAKEAAARAKA